MLKPYLNLLLAAAAMAAGFTGPAAAAGRAEQKEWTIMIYMNGKNNLGPFVERDIREMERAGAPGNVNVVLQAARLEEPVPPPAYSPSNPFTPGGGFGGLRRGQGRSWSGTRRYLLRGGGEPGAAAELLAELGDADMGDWRRLEEFGRWAKENYPARRYMMIVWNHGSGWLLRDSADDYDDRSISSDDATKNSIEVPELAAALRGMGGVDVYASDACLMQMAEVVYELRDAAGIVVGSEANEPGEGWGYDQFLARLRSNKDSLTPETLAAAAVQGYRAAHEHGDEPATLSAVRTEGFERLRAALDAWALGAMKEDREELSRAWDASLGFGWVGSRDLADFMELIHEGGVSPELKALTRAVLREYYSGLLIQSEAAGPGMAAARGLSIYMPRTYDPTYGRLAWARDGRWDDFLRWIMGV